MFLIFIAIISVFACFCGVGLFTHFNKRADWVDVFWSLSFLLAVVIYAVGADGNNARQTLAVVMVAVWAFRLAWHVARRLTKHDQEDRRYAALRQGYQAKNQNESFRFFIFFQLQGAASLVLSLPFLAAVFNPNPSLGWAEWAAALLLGVAVVGESIADRQLAQFKANPKNQGQVCQVGLWKYSRHPNYFFEWLVWVAFFIFCASSAPWGWLGLMMPALMYYVLVHVTGVPPSEEQSLASRGDAYRQYQQNTPAFFPSFLNPFSTKSN